MTKQPREASHRVSPPSLVGPSVMQSAAFMSMATLCSRVLGMVRDMVMTAFFPILVYDAFVVAFRLPNLFRRVLGEGSLAASFVPLYIEILKHNKEEAKRFSNAVFSMLSVVTATLSVLGIIIMPWVMKNWVSGDAYLLVEGKLELTVLMARIMFGYLFLVTTYAFLMSIANAHKVFFLPALAPAAFNLAAIVFSLLPPMFVQGDQLAIGVMVGGVLQLIIVLVTLIKIKALPKPTFHWGVNKVSQFFKVVIPSMLGMSIAQLLGVLNVSFASELPQGSHSYIYLADRLLELPQSLLSVSMGVALLPTLSEYWVNGKRALFLSEVQRHMRLLSVLSLPAAVGLYVLAEPIIKVIYARGQFGDEQVASTASVLTVYSIVLIVSGLHRVTVPAFYAIKNTWLPAANSAFCLVVHYFVASWATKTYGLQGLVGATAFTGALNLTILLMSFRLYFGEIGAWAFLKSTFWLAPSLIAMGFLTPKVYAYVYELSGGIIALIVSILCAVAVYVLLNKALRHPEVIEFMNLLKRKAQKK